MSPPDFVHVSSEATAHVTAAMDAWVQAGGDVAEIATAMFLQGYATHLILGGRVDIIDLYASAARALEPFVGKGS